MVRLNIEKPISEKIYFMQLNHTLIQKASKIFQKRIKQFCPISDRNPHLRNKSHKKHDIKVCHYFFLVNITLVPVNQQMWEIFEFLSKAKQFI